MNAKEATDFSTAETLNNAVFAQTKNTRHVVNCIQIPQYNNGQQQDQILFSAEHFCTKWKNKKLIQHAELFKINDGKRVNVLSLLLYSINMPVAILTNQCTLLRIANEAQAVFYSIIVLPHSE